MFLLIRIDQTRITPLTSLNTPEILFQNEHALIVDKPALWLTVPGRTANDERPILGKILEENLKIKIFPVHRLDAEVSGAILFATSADFHRAANLAFEHKKIKKTYQAFTCVGSFAKGQTILWKSKLVRGKKRTFEAPYGKDSVTEGVLTKKTASHMEWLLNPVTGRAHQLRFELFKNKCPIIGDKLYGSDIAWDHPGIALRALQIDFPQDFVSAWGLPSSLEAKPLPPL